MFLRRAKSNRLENRTKNDNLSQVGLKQLNTILNTYSVAARPRIESQTNLTIVANIIVIAALVH